MRSTFPSLAMLLLPAVSFAVICPLTPTPPAAGLDAAYRQVLVDGPGCSKEGDGGCSKVSGDLKDLQSKVLDGAIKSSSCAQTGESTVGTPLPGTDKAWYSTRADFWYALYNDMKNNAAAVGKGTYRIPTDFQAEYLGVAIPVTPVLPVIEGKLSAGMSKVKGKAQRVDAIKFPTASQISVCVWTAQPVAGDSLDCTLPASTTKASPLSNAKAQGPTGSDYVLTSADAKGSFLAQLKTPLANGQFVSLVEVSTTSTSPDVPQTVLSKKTSAVGPATQCNTTTLPFSDCDLKFSLIGGVEQSAQSTLPSETTGFLRVFTRAAPFSKDDRFNIWADVRLLGAPAGTSTTDVISVVTNPSGTLIPQTFSTVGTSLDYMFGVEYELRKNRANRANGYSISLIAGFGGTTPLQVNPLALAYTSPAFGTVECAQLFPRFSHQFGVENIIAGSANNTTFPVTTPPTTTPSCLVNQNSPTTTTGNGATTTTYAPIKTIGFSNQDRASFLGKEVFGFRTIDRFLGSGNVACGDPDTVNRIGPCERGVVDWTFGQDASITGGMMRRYIFKIDAVHPLPVASVNFLYLFGSVSLRISPNKDYAPLILQSADVASLTGTGANAIPNPSVVVLSLVQPDRDYYRFGVGVNASQLFTTLFSAIAGHQ